MQKQALFISLCMGAAILIFIIFLTAMQYSKSNKHSVYGKNNPDDWLFHNFYLKSAGQSGNSTYKRSAGICSKPAAPGALQPQERSCPS